MAMQRDALQKHIDMETLLLWFTIAVKTMRSFCQLTVHTYNMSKFIWFTKNLPIVITSCSQEVCARTLCEYIHMDHFK